MRETRVRNLDASIVDRLGWIMIRERRELRRLYTNGKEECRSVTTISNKGQGEDLGSTTEGERNR